MKPRQRVIVLAIVILILLISAVYGMNDLNTKDLFSVRVQKGQNSIMITPWMDNDAHLYVVLPSYADMSSATIVAGDGAEIWVNGERINEEINCGVYQPDTPYQVTYQRLGRKRDFVLTFLESASVSTMYIETETGKMDYVHGKKRNAEAGTVQLYQENGELQYSGSMKSIAGRGNTTWDDYEKKSYTVDFGENQDILGMGAARDWLLLANAADPSNMRNKIVYDFAAQAGLPYSPESRWVDVYLNGEYAGLYLLTEQNEVHTERIAIENENSFLVTMEGRGRMVTQKLPYIETDLRQALRIRHPKDPSEEQLQELTRIWNGIEKAITESDEANESNTADWSALIDLDSWARKYLIEEIFGSLDACYKSQYFYYDGNYENSPVMAGPVWDFDLSMGRTWHTESLDFLWANRLQVDDQYSTPWFHELYKKDEFFGKLKEIFRQEMLPLLKALYEEDVLAYHDEIAKAARINQIRWQTESYDDEVQLINDYLARRIDFLTRLWIEEREIHLVKAGSEGASYAYFAVEDGASLQNLPVLESSELRTFQGWYTEDGVPFDETVAIYEDISIYAKWDGVSNKIAMYAQYFVPLAVIAFMGLLLLFADFFRMRKGRYGR